MYLNRMQISPAFQGRIKVQKAKVLKNGNVIETVKDFSIDTNEIKRIDSVRVDTDIFAKELGLPNEKHIISSFRKSVEKTCSGISLITLYNDVKYRIEVAKEKFLEAYSNVSGTDFEIIL